MSRIRIGDCVVILVILLLAGVIFLASLLPKEAGNTLTVKGESGEADYSLLEDQSFKLESGGYTLHIVIRDKKAYVLSSDCPDKSCVHQGKIDRVGEAVICVPAGVVLRIRGEGGNEEDVIAG